MSRPAAWKSADRGLPSDLASLPAWARSTARELLDGREPRLTHVLAVGVKAETIATQLDSDFADLLVLAAYLHDIGYAPALVDTGLHQIDGARWLARCGHLRLAALVAHHTCAQVEMELRGRGDLLEPFPPPARRLAAALTYCDITTGPTGQDVTVHERIEEVGLRRGRDSIVFEALLLARPRLEQAVSRTVTARATSRDRRPLG